VFERLKNMYVGLNFIGGDSLAHKSDFPSLDPCTNEPIGYFPSTKQERVKEAVIVARKAAIKWRAKSRIERADLFDNLAQLIKEKKDHLADTISLETGKNRNESIAEVNESLHMCQVAAARGREPYGEMIASELPEKDAYTFRKPKGVVAVISPWNFPMAIGGFWTTSPALVEGNTVVWKPSEETPICAQEIYKLYEKAGFPDGVLNLIHGDGQVGEWLVKSDVDCILFTGSAEVGMSIRKHCASTWNKTCSCEMGSKSAVVIFAENDKPLSSGMYDMAVEASVTSALKLTGQRCVSASRIIIQEKIYDAFCYDFCEKVLKLRYGPPDNVDNFFGPLINQKQVSRVKYYNNLVRKDPRAEVMIDGDEVGIGNLMSPFVYKTKWKNAPYLKDEVFGPHVALIPFRDVNDAIRIYNDTDYGLSLAVFTEDFKIARRMRDECDYGMMYFNAGTIGAESHLPFGGLKKSGNGWSSAAGTFEAVTHKVTLTINHGKKVRWAQGLR